MSTIRILHLEDDVVDVDWFARAIERLAQDRALTGDIEIVHCPTLDEAVEYLHHQEVSVAVLDLMVPDARPTEVVERVRSAAPGVPVIVLSARGLEALRHDGLVGEIHASVCKTETSIKTLGDVLRSTIDLSRAQLQLRSIIHRSADGTVVVDETGVIRFANRAACELFGLPLESLVGSEFGAPVVESECAEIRVGADRIVEMRVVEIEWEARRAHLASLRDVTARHQAAQALRESEQRLRAISDTAHDAIVTFDDHHRIVGLNPAAERMFGRDHGGVQGSTIHELVARSDGDLLRTAIDGRADGAPPDLGRSPLVLRGQRSPGTSFPMEVSFGRWKTSEGEFTTGFFRDITDRLRAEEEARRWAAIFEYCAWGALVARAADGVIQMVNPGLVRMSGLPENAILGESLIRLFPGDQQAVVEDGLRQAREAGSYRFECIYRGTDERAVPVLVDVTSVRGAGGDEATVAVHIHDISDRKALEQQLSAARRMEALGRLSGGVAHDFNNLLTPIVGQAEILLAELDPASPIRSQLAVIRDAGIRAAGLTRQLLTFGRAHPTAARVLDLGDLIRQTSKLLGQLIGEHIRLQTSISADLGAVRVDPTQMEQVLVNLVANARDSMPDGGTVTVELANVEIEGGGEQGVIGAPAGPYVLLAVTDTGSGMDSDTVARIFEPFFTTKALGKGTGLGLATVHGIVSQAGGAIAVDSAIGRGTVFKVYLPRTFDRPRAITRSAPKAAAAKRGNETILVVEDEALVREVAVRALRALGYSVLEASRPSAALELLDGFASPIDLLLTDVIMPEMSGPTMIAELRRRWPIANVVYMSGYTSSSVGDGALDDARTRFLAKPFTIATLADTVRSALDSRPSPALAAT